MLVMSAQVCLLPLAAWCLRLLHPQMYLVVIAIPSLLVICPLRKGDYNRADKCNAMLDFPIEALLQRISSLLPRALCDMLHIPHASQIHILIPGKSWLIERESPIKLRQPVYCAMA